MTGAGHLPEPALLPRIGLAVCAMYAALVGPLGLAGLLIAGGLVPVWRHPTRGVRTGALVAVVGVVVGTIVLTPVWLHLLAGVPLSDAVVLAAAFAFRLGAVVAVGSGLGAALPPRAWVAGVARFPSLGLALGLTFRQVPDLVMDAGRIRQAQRARGLHLGPRAWGPRAVAVPLMQRALARADRMASALVLSGWGRPGRQPVRRTRWAWRDVWWLALAVVVVWLAGHPAFN